MDSSWFALGACRGEDPNTFFPARKEPWKVKAAKEICSRCPVSEKCLEWAIYHNERDGVWGGVSARKRRLLRRDAVANETAITLCEECGGEFYGTSQMKLCSEECRLVRRRESRRRYEASKKESVA